MSAVSPDMADKLHPVIYPFTINPKTVNKDFNDLGTHTPLTEDYGYVLIPASAYRQKEDRGGSLGIIVAHTPGDHYSACELRCARCLYEFKKQSKMKPIKSISPGKVLGFLECPSCGAQMGSFVFTGSPTLDAYDNRGRGIISQETYCINYIRDEHDEIIELRICNSPGLLQVLENESKSKPRRKVELTREDYFPHAKKSEFE